MNLNNFTIKSQETLQQAITLARSNGNQALEPVHILKALMSEGESVVKFILQKLDIAPSMIERPLENELARLPKVNGGDPYLSNNSGKVLDKASEIAQKNGDQYVTIEAIFMALHEVSSPASTILKDAGVTKKELQATIDELRKGKKALPVRSFMKMLGLSARSPAVLFLLGRHIVKALRPEKVSVGSPADPPGKAQRPAEFRMRIIGGKAVIPGPALRIEPGSHSDGFQQRGFPAAVLPHKKRDRIPESDLSHPCQRRNASQIAALFNFIPVDKQAAERQAPVRARFA